MIPPRIGHHKDLEGNITVESSAPVSACLGGGKQGQCPSQAVSREDQIPIAGHRIEKASCTGPRCRGPAPKLRVSTTSQGRDLYLKRIHGYDLEPFTDVFFGKGKKNENQHGTENHRFGWENPAEPNLYFFVWWGFMLVFWDVC